MKYDYNNAPGAVTIESETGLALEKVRSVDTYTGEVICYVQPLVVNSSRTDLEKYTLRFQFIEIIQRPDLPKIFYCIKRIFS